MAATAITPDRARHKGVKGSTELVIQVLQVSQGIENAIVAIALHAFSAILIAFHSVLGFVRAFCFTVKLAHSDQVESVSQQLWLDLHVNLAVTCEWRRQVDLDQPGLEVTINHDVKAVDLITICPVNASLFAGSQDVVLSRQEAFDYHVENTTPEEIHIDVDLLQVLAESWETPFKAEVIILKVVIVHIVLTLLVDGVVRQMREFVPLCGIRRIFLGCEPSKSFLKNINAQRVDTSHADIDP